MSEHGHHIGGVGHGRPLAPEPGPLGGGPGTEYPNTGRATAPGPAHIRYWEDLNKLPSRQTTKQVTFLDNIRLVFDELENILVTKQAAYGPHSIADSPGGAEQGLRVRIHDKTSRLNHLLDENRSPVWESIEDTILDIANYYVIWTLVRRKQWPGVA